MANCVSVPNRLGAAGLIQPTLLINHYRRCCKKTPRRLGGNAESRPPLYLKRLLDMDNQIGDDAVLVKALGWAVARQSEDALAAAPPRSLLSIGTENERNRFP